MKYIFTLIQCFIAASFVAQFQVGHLPAGFTDPSRNNRYITCEIYYPATTAGDFAPLAAGQFPFVVFGHGFVMDYTAYANITEALISEGYILIYVETEGGFAPVHSDFGLDLAYMADHFYDESANAASLFYASIQDRCAIMGHSMGGGSTWLAAATSTSVDCIAGLAPAETNPSAIAAASNVTVPAIVFSGSSDAVTAPATNHTPIFESTASECKYFVNIIDGSHCGYADSGSLCDFGELGFAGLSREEQQAITHDLLLAFFDVYLKDISSGSTIIQGYDNTQSNTETQIECFVGLEEGEPSEMSVYPNPCAERLILQSIADGKKTYIVSDFLGRQVDSGSLVFSNGRAELETQQLRSGIYTLQINDMHVVRFVKR